MAKISVKPKVGDAPADEAFVQVVELREDGRVVGRALWMAPSDLSQGVAQILDLTIAPEFRRKGFGSQLAGAVLEQVRTYFKAREAKLRRVWLSVEQKSQVVARAFLMKHNFHHTASVSELLKGQDALICTRAFD